MGNLSRMVPEEQKGKDVADVSLASLLWSTVSRVVAVIVKVKTDVERNAADCQLPFFFFFCHHNQPNMKETAASL